MMMTQITTAAISDHFQSPSKSVPSHERRTLQQRESERECTSAFLNHFSGRASGCVVFFKERIMNVCNI